ncbi:MAG: hypothetical protein AAGU11_13650 [Syntrophobacteraceae bacterium]
MIKKVLRLILGGIFLVLGVAGLVLPVLQGFFFLTLGIITLSRDIPFLARLENRLILRFPKAGHFAEKLRKAIPLWDD